jgi:hypothetical protein
MPAFNVTLTTLQSFTTPSALAFRYAGVCMAGLFLLHEKAEMIDRTSIMERNFMAFN